MSADAARRRFLARAAALGAAPFLRPIGIARAAATRFSAYPFALGVASGSPRSDGVVLWTRLAPKPLQDGGMDPEPREVRWEVAADDRFRRIVKRGTAIAVADRAHAVHVEVDGLEPAREYHYRFIAGGDTSTAGRTRTAPAPGRGDERLRLAFASCQQYEQGYYVSHRHLAGEDVDLIAFLGDYIYESSWGDDHVRKHNGDEPRTLAEYRNRHALYKSDEDLQRLHAVAPWILTWDDHEVENDYANDLGEDMGGDFLARRASAYRAYFEHMPLRISTLRAGGALRIYDRYAWGSLATIHTLDDRQYRSRQACRKPGGGAPTVGPACDPQRLDERRTLLGAEQERWLDEGLAESRSRWNVIAQETLFAEASRTNDKGVVVHWTDGWEGYPAARTRLLRSIAGRKPSNPIVIGGDLHTNYVADIRMRAGDSRQPILATEFCGTSMTSQGFAPSTVEAIRAANPDIHLANTQLRGYVVLDIARDRVEAKLRCVETVKRNEAGISTLATFTVLDGRPGIQK